MTYPEIKKVALYGIGIIGAGWATGLSVKGVDVALYGRSDESLEKARQKVANNFAGMVEGGLLTQTQVDDALTHITYTTDVAVALADVQLVVESVAERMDVKQAVYETVDTYCGADVIVASSTSSMLISKLAEMSKYPERCICAHPYNPPHLIPLVELVGIEGGEDAIEHTRKFLLEMGKKPVVLQKETKGFIANRLQVVVGREIVEMVKRGVCSVEDCEDALTYGPGLRWAVMGHNLTMQLGGGAGGVRGMFEKVVAKGGDRSSYLDDLGNWIKYPDDWPEVCQEGVDRALAQRAEGTGHDNASLAAYRDKMLIEILKLHETVKLDSEEVSK